MRSLAWLSEKGGTGKTTSAINTAVCMARMKKRVLLIDADPQANASMVFLKGEAADPPTLYHVLTHQADAGDTIRRDPGPGSGPSPGRCDPCRREPIPCIGDWPGATSWPGNARRRRNVRYRRRGYEPPANLDQHQCALLCSRGMVPG